jgi:hypothetical protein
MKQLTRIEKLDQQYPGLADQVRRWFALGVHVRKVSELLHEHYHVSVPQATVANFRAHRWVRELEARDAESARRGAAVEICRELEIKDRPEAPTASLQSKVRWLLSPNAGGRIKRALDRMRSEHRLPKMPPMKREIDFTGVE